jgi:hypothetical protein
VTHTEIIYRRCLAVLALANETGNVAAACRTFGISRTRYYEWSRTTHGVIESLRTRTALVVCRPCRC